MSLFRCAVSHGSALRTALRLERSSRPLSRVAIARCLASASNSSAGSGRRHQLPSAATHRVSLSPAALNVPVRHFAAAPNMAVPPEKASVAVRLQWADITVEKIESIRDDVVAIGTKMAESVSAVPLGDVTYDNTIQMLEDSEREMSTKSSMVTFPAMIYADKAIRDASTAAGKVLSQFSVELRCNKEIFDRVEAFKGKSYDGLAAQSKRYVDHFIRDGRRLGLHLSEEVRTKVKDVDQQLSKLSIDFSRNLAEETTTLSFTREQLEGMAEDFITSLEKAEDGKLLVSLKYPHTVPIGNMARNAETRRQLNVAFNSRCKVENTSILEEMLELRKQKATLLSYPTYADYVLETRMAGSSGEVHKFLSTLSDRLTPLMTREFAKLLDYKREECSALGRAFDGKMNAWDVNYYKTRVEEKEYSIDQDSYKVFFPMDRVTKGLLAIYQDLLGVVFTKVDDADVWHPDVTMYRVTEKENGWILGSFYLDLHPREGKYGHAAVFPLQPGAKLSSGERQIAVCACVCNFTKPSADKPSLLMHSEVETFFHEFGHVMHHICSMNVQHSRFSGTRVERDFVEAPSQMLENWCWQREPLQRMSAHYKTGEPLPAAMIEKLVESRNANVGLFMKRQLCFGLFDQHVHTSQEKIDTQSVFKKFSEDVNGYSPAEGTSFPATFNHIAGGYEAQYYGYMWSDVFSYDMFFSRFEKEGVMNPEVGKQYRQLILAPGGSRDAKDMLRDFLGREPNQNAFLEKQGLSSLS